MRPIAIALAFMVFVPGVILADDRAASESERKPSDLVARIPVSQLLDGRRGDQPRLRPNGGFNFLPEWLDDRGDNSCYTMRSYFVKQDDPESDATRLVGYTTCQSASKFRIKVAGEDLVDPH